jgi:hypothetical protein
MNTALADVETGLPPELSAARRRRNVNVAASKKWLSACLSWAATGGSLSGGERRLWVELAGRCLLWGTAGIGATRPFTVASAEVGHPPEAAFGLLFWNGCLLPQGSPTGPRR